MSVAERVEFAKQMKENGRRYFLVCYCTNLGMLTHRNRISSFFVD